MPKSKAKDEKEKPQPQLNVRPFPSNLLRRINAIAGATDCTQADLVIAALEEFTKGDTADVEAIVRRHRELRKEV